MRETGALHEAGDARSPSTMGSMIPGESLESRILILAPTGSDAPLTARFLSEGGLGPRICPNLEELYGEVKRGCGAIILAEEVLADPDSALLVEALADQPKWSEVPLILITSGGEATREQLRRWAVFGPQGVTILERPFRPATLVSTTETALRSRLRQYEVRRLMEEMEQMLREREIETRQFEATLSSINDLAYRFDLEGNWVYANQPLLKIWGKTLDEIAGKSSLELGYPEELAERLRQQVRTVVETRKPFRGETYYTDAQGVEDYHEYIFSPIFAPDGSVSAVCGITRLTTERKRAEAVAEGHRSVLQLIAEGEPLPRILEVLAATVELDLRGRWKVGVRVLKAGANPSTSADSLSPSTGDLQVGTTPGAPLPSGPEGKKSGEWTFPILAKWGEVLGLFTLSGEEPADSSETTERILEAAAHTAAVAIERKFGEEAILESQERYHQLVHGLPAAIYTTDVVGRVQIYNEAAENLWGRPPEPADPWCGCLRLYRPDGAPVPREEFPVSRALTENRIESGREYLLERPDGSRRFVIAYPNPTRDGSGRLVGAVNMLVDVTERKRAEQESRRLAAIVESSDDAIISKDLEGRITSWNAGAQKLFGYVADEVIGRPITILFPKENLEEEVGILARIRSGRRVDHYETVRRRKDGSPVEVSLTISPMKDEHGKVVGASKIVRDITEVRQATRALEIAHEKALAAARAKDDFLAALSHELRTPLNPVLLLASEAADDPELPPAVRAQFELVRNGVEMEARLIDDLLDLTRITHGKLLLEKAPVDCHNLLRAAVATVQADIDRKKIHLTLDLGADRPWVEGDAVRLQQIFWNILKNAVKFTPEGGRIALETRPEGGALEVTVTDSGIGLSPEELDTIFESFSQGEHASSEGKHRFGGLGLGLAISRMLVERHRGTIEARSEGRDRGASFVVRIPSLDGGPAGKTSDTPRPRFQAPPSREPLRILLVEDHAATRQVIEQLLARRGFEVSSVGSLAEAREQAATAAFHLVISDLGLPDGNGDDLIHELRLRQPGLPGIALTGYGMEADLIRSREAGFLSHLIKPVRVEALETAIRAALGDGGSRGGESAEPPTDGSRA